MAKKLEDRTEGRFVIALPKEDLGVHEYNLIDKIGGSVATTPAGAVGNYLFRKIPQKARLVMGTLRNDFGGAESYALRIPSEYREENGTLLTGDNKMAAEEIEVASFLAEQYGGDSRNYLERARRVLSEFKKKH
ncbi:Uncharacterised protein [uncultured archaeon]|nr:Uncharacterised protein [uncultured archaeon]